MKNLPSGGDGDPGKERRRDLSRQPVCQDTGGVSPRRARAGSGASPGVEGVEVEEGEAATRFTSTMHVRQYFGVGPGMRFSVTSLEHQVQVKLIGCGLLCIDTSKYA